MNPKILFPEHTLLSSYGCATQYNSNLETYEKRINEAWYKA